MTTTLLNNRYQVIQVLSAGGFGETFLAEDTYMPSRRRCVIKQLKPVTNDPKTYRKIQQRFEREAATLEYLGEASDQIPKLYAYFSENGQFYLVQEWIQGRTLTDIVKAKGSLNETAVREILLSLLPVLDYIHSKGIIHRDIKPDNILLGNPSANSTASDLGGKPVLIDFGAVKATVLSEVDASGYLTQSLVMGTPGYMPSEQAVGRPLFATDIYSLGLTAIYLLTGKRPQELQTNPQTGEILWQHHAPGVSPNLAMILDRAIKPQASDRYTTASKMLHALQSATARRQLLQLWQPEERTASPTQTAATQPTLFLPPPSGASPQQNQTLSYPRNIPVTLASPTIRNRQKLTWIVGSLVVGGVIGAVAIARINAGPVSEAPIATAPSPTPRTESPMPTNKVANTPVASQPPRTPIAQTLLPRRRTTSQNKPLKSDLRAVPVASTLPAPHKNNTRNHLASTTNISHVPAFPTGTPRSIVETALGKPAKDSRGVWQNTRAVTYKLVPNQIELGYLFNRDSGVIRQTEVAFAQSVDFQVMLTTSEGMLGGKATEEVKQGLQQVQQRQLDNYSFTKGSLKGQIVRQECDLIYISIWDADLHDFESPSDSRKC